jgi:membrane-associated phospholipid phosphatase
MTDLRDAVHQFDEWADARFEPLRDQPAVGAVMKAASTLGDFSVVWHITGLVRGLGGGRRARQAARFAVLIGAESLIVNQGIKRLFRRIRPTETGDPRYTVRKPSTSSFPSGHASSAFFAASVLTFWGGRRSALLWYPMAAVVAVSRVFVRIHHASDIVAGALVGTALGRVARAALRRFP